ncbi:hypothetical protein [Salipiger abyssi]|uniref:hypothetical protein n=1 Tax=Salipiger abyssi TaxID=1250539 RepID=UPI0040582776
MYVERRTLETRFNRAIRGTQHIAIFGDSGNGKTWLYQKVLKERKCSYLLVDLSIARTNGLDNAFRAALENPYGWQPESKSESKTGGVKLGIDAKAETGTQYTFADEPPFDKLITQASKLKGENKFIVFDNLESVTNSPEILEQISSYILRLDNPKFAKFGVRFLFVGVVNDIRAILSGGVSASTISNRIYELPEVKPLTKFEAEKVLRTGYLEILQIDFGDDEEDAIYGSIFYSGRSAQHLHEIGLNVGFQSEENDWIADWSIVSSAIIEWCESSLAGHTATVRARLNKKETRVQRRNQVLYCIAKRAEDEFTVSEVDTMVRKEFPHNTNVTQLGIDQILKGLCQGDLPLLLRDSSTNRFRFSHPKLRLAIRYVLRKSDSGDISENSDLAKQEYE